VTTLSYTLDFGDLGASGGGGRAVVACDGHAPLEQGYFADVGRIDGVFGMSLPDAAADLVAIAVAVHVADRAAPRRRHDRADPYGLGWRRHLHLRVPVRDPRRWGGASLLQGLQATLEYFTDDAWSFDFVGLAADEAPRQGYLFPHRPPNPAVALFSGGLDALIGAADLLASDARPTLIALSAGTNRRTIGRQRELVAALGGRPGRGIRHVEVPCNLRATDVAEPTQRARGFVFLALAAAVAEQAGCATIALCENGIGALSLPYNRTQVGAHTTRAAHPLALDRMGRFLGAALGRPIRIRNPYLFETKGQMCARLAGLGIADLAARSVSCDTFASRRDGAGAHCGLCTSCLLRRLGLHAAGLAAVDARSGYAYDVTDPRGHATEQQLLPLFSMLDQLGELRRCLRAATPWARLAEAYPILEEIRRALEPVTDPRDGDVAQALVRLLGTYADEWHAFPVAARARLVG